MEKQQDQFIYKKRKYDSNTQYPKSSQTYKDGGIHMSQIKNPIGVGIVANVFKQISGKLMSGQIKNINAISKPTRLCEDITFAQIVSLDNNATQYLDLAAAAQDPVERMQFVVTFLIASIYSAPKRIYAKIPFDSVIGETVQYEKQNGTKYYAETVETGPSAIQVQICGANKSWELSYCHKVDAKLALPKMNDIDAQAIHQKIIRFHDGTEIKCENMMLHIGGILIGERYMKLQNHIRILDLKNDLQGDIDFEYTRTGTIMAIGKSLTGWWSGNKEKVRQPEDFKVKIYKYMDKNQNLLAFRTPYTELDQNKENTRRAICSQGTGNYVSYIQFDQQLLWQIDDKMDEWQMCSSNNILPSDSQFRQEIGCVTKQDYDQAEKLKNQSEQQDYQDQQLRLKFKKQQK